MNHHVNNVKYVGWMVEVIAFPLEPRLILSISATIWPLCLSRCLTIHFCLQTIPDEFLEAHQLSSIVLEYRRELGSSDIVQSLCEPDGDGILQSGVQHDSYQVNMLNGYSLASEIFQGSGLLGSFGKTTMPFKYTHLLQINGESENKEIIRGRTTWKKRITSVPFPPR